jgi:diacylglycerol kinase family enzyme
LSVEKATELLINGKEMLVDLAEIKMNKNIIWSFNIIGCGLVSHINILAEKLRWLGAARYNIATIINIIVNPVLKAKIYFNDEIHAKDYCFLLACNTRFTGKGMEMAPLAKLNDGLIDFLIVEKTSRLKLLIIVTSKLGQILKTKQLGLGLQFRWIALILGLGLEFLAMRVQMSVKITMTTVILVSG